MHTASAAASAGLNDVELARRVAGGDREALESMMRRCNQRMFRAARAILRDDAEAEDAVQEAYVLAYRAIGGFRGEARLSSWLVRIAVNEAIQRLRRRQRSAEVIVLDAGAEAGGEAPDADARPAGAWGPEEAALGAEMRRILEATIDRLPEAFRVVFVLRTVEEMTVDEIAACLRIPEATVRSRHFRARALLREALAREIDFGIEDAFHFAGERCDRIVAAVLARIGAAGTHPTPPVIRGEPPCRS